MSDVDNMIEKLVLLVRSRAEELLAQDLCENIPDEVETNAEKRETRNMLSGEFKEAIQKELERQGKGNTKTYSQADFLLTLMTEDVVKSWCNEAQARLKAIHATAESDAEDSRQFRKRIRELEKGMQSLRNGYKDLSAYVNNPVVEMDNQAKIAIAMYKNLTEIAKDVGADGNIAAKEGAYIVWAYLTKTPPGLAVEADSKDSLPPPASKKCG